MDELTLVHSGASRGLLQFSIRIQNHSWQNQTSTSLHFHQFICDLTLKTLSCNIIISVLHSCVLGLFTWCWARPLVLHEYSAHLLMQWCLENFYVVSEISFSLSLYSSLHNKHYIENSEWVNDLEHSFIQPVLTGNTHCRITMAILL